MNRLDGKIAIVTGGASGIGLATARLFAACGAQVVVVDIADGTEIAAELSAAYLRCDVTDAEAVERMVAAVVDRFGRLDVLFNNAGIEIHGSLADTAADAHRRVIDVNVNGVYFCLQSAIRAMVKNDGPLRGSIVNTASVAGLTGVPGMSSYNGAKAAVVMFTKNAALEYGSAGIRVNAVCPGIVRTPMGLAAIGDEATLEQVGRLAHPLGRVCEPEDVARLVAFLSSDDASFISGAAVPIDGAMTAGFSAAPGWEPSF